MANSAPSQKYEPPSLSNAQAANVLKALMWRRFGLARVARPG